MDIDPNAPVISRHSVVVRASPASIRALRTDVPAWQEWQPGITSASLPGPFSVGAVFSWKTFGLNITSTVAEVEPLRRACWGGPAHGIVGVHVWTFALEGDRDGLGRRERDACPVGWCCGECPGVRRGGTPGLGRIEGGRAGGAAGCAPGVFTSAAP